MKAVLVMEMPESCAECPLSMDSSRKGNMCRGCGKRSEDRSRKPGWCPLVPVPEKTNVPDFGWVDVWNACIDAVEGSRG